MCFFSPYFYYSILEDFPIELQESSYFRKAFDTCVDNSHILLHLPVRQFLF